MSKHIGTFSELHGPKGRILTEYVDQNIPSLWDTVPETIIDVQNTGTYYTGNLEDWGPQSSINYYPVNKLLWFSPHVPNNSNANLSISGLLPIPFTLGDGSTAIPSGSMVPGNTYLLRVHQSGAALEVLSLSGPPGPPGTSVLNRAQLAALPISYQSAFLLEAGRQGTFQWNGIDLSDEVANDPEQGIYVPFTGSDGSLGAWTRRNDGGLRPKWFGAQGDGNPANMALDTKGWQAAINFSAFSGIPITDRDAAVYIVDGHKGDHAIWSGSDLSRHGGLVLTDGAHIHGAGAGKTVLKNGADNWRSVIRVQSGTISISDLTVDGDIDNHVMVSVGEEDETHGSVRGEGIIFEGAGVIEHFELIRLDIRNTGHYGIGLENVSIKSGLIDSPFFANIGGDCIDGKYYDPAAGGHYKKNIYIYNLRTLDGAVNHYPGKYLPSEGNTDQTVVDMCAGMHLHGAFISGFNCTGSTQTETTALRFRPKVAGQLVGPAGASASLIRINSSLAPGTGNNTNKNVVGVSIEDDGVHLSDVVVESCYRGVVVGINADGLPLSGTLNDISIADATSSDGTAVGLTIGASVKGIFGRGILARRCETGARLSCTQSDIDLRIEDSSILQLNMSDGALGQNRVKPSFSRVNVTPSIGDFDPAVAPIAASSQVAGVTPLAVVWDGEANVVQSRRAYVNLVSTASDNTWVGADEILGGIQAYGSDLNGAGAGVKGAIRARASISGATTRWEFSAASTIANDIPVFRMGSTQIVSMMPFTLPEYTIATLPAAVDFRACMVMITNPVGNKRPVFSDGTIWRYFDGTAV